MRAKPLPDPCFWRAWDAGQHILPAARARAAALAEQATQKGSGEAQPQPSASPSQSLQLLQGCSRESPAGRTSAALIYTRPGAIQPLHMNFSSSFTTCPFGFLTPCSQAPDLGSDLSGHITTA